MTELTALLDQALLDTTFRTGGGTDSSAEELHQALTQARGSVFETRRSSKKDSLSLIERDARKVRRNFARLTGNLIDAIRFRVTPGDAQAIGGCPCLSTRPPAHMAPSHIHAVIWAPCYAKLARSMQPCRQDPEVVNWSVARNPLSLARGTVMADKDSGR